LGYYYVVGHLVRSLGNGSVVVIYLSNNTEIPRIFGGFANASRVALLLQKQVEEVDLYIHSNSILENRIQIPADLIEYNKKNPGAITQ